MPPHHLDYSPPPPLHHRRKFRRWLLLAALLLFTASSYFWWNDLVLRCRLYYWQQKCLNYAPPPTQVVYENDPAKAQRLTTQPYDSSQGVYLYLAPEWAMLYGLLSPPGRLPAATLFLHERRSPSGKRWLVAVHTGAGDSFDVDLVERAALPSRPKLVLSRGTKHHFPPRTVSRYYAGQPDPIHESHFTIAFDTPDGETHILDGWIKDNQTVVLEERSPPPTTAP